MRHDLISDVFVILKNAENVGKHECVVKASNLTKDILKAIQKHKYIGDFEFIDDGKGGKFKIQLLGKINNCNSIKPRFSVKKGEIIKYEKRYLPADKIGLLLVTTSKGVFDHHEAKKEKVGGKLVGYIY